MPTPPAPPTRFGIFRTPGRNRSFSFEADHESGGSSAPPTGGLPPVVDNRRNRTVTTSSTSTATPPRLVDSDLALENSELDGFGNMFDHIRSSPDPAPIRLIQQEVQPFSASVYFYFQMLIMHRLRHLHRQVILQRPIQVQAPFARGEHPFPGPSRSTVAKLLNHLRIHGLLKTPMMV